MATADARPRTPRGVAGLLAVLVLLGVGGAVVALGGPTPADPAAAPLTPTSPPASPPVTPGPVPVVPIAPATPVRPPAGSPTTPVRVSAPAQDIEVPVDPVGVAPDGQMEIPPLAERGGWYRFGSDPGDAAGTTVVAAHVDSVASQGTGPFVRLGDLRPGDEVQVALADGSTRAYAVQEVTRVPKDQASWPDVFTRDGPPRLALVTCGGTFDRASRHYADNVLVIATPRGA